MLKPVPAPHTSSTIDPSREALASAIAESEGAQRAVEMAREAIYRTREMVARTEARHSLALAAVTSAKAAAASRLATAAASGSGVGPDRSIRDARAEETDALDELEVARAALETVEAAILGPLDALKRARKGVEEEARSVLRTAIAPSTAAVERAKVELGDAMVRLWFLHQEVFQWPPTDESKSVEQHLSTPQLQLTADDPALAPWHEAVAALLRDANATLPETTARSH